MCPSKLKHTSNSQWKQNFRISEDLLSSKKCTLKKQGPSFLQKEHFEIFSMLQNNEHTSGLWAHSFNPKNCTLLEHMAHSWSMKLRSSLRVHGTLTKHESLERMEKSRTMKLHPSIWAHGIITKPKAWVHSFGKKNCALFEYMSASWRLECLSLVSSTCALAPSLSSWVYEHTLKARRLDTLLLHLF